MAKEDYRQIAREGTDCSSIPRARSRCVIPPSAPGECRIRDGSAKVKHVGETNNIRRRVGEHMKKGKLKDSTRALSIGCLHLDHRIHLRGATIRGGAFPNTPLT